MVPSITHPQQNNHSKFQYPLNRGDVPKTVDEWLQWKRLCDNTGELWRVHDNLYDLTELVNSHPGGPQWISASKGTDITEAFETHHLKGIAEATLPNYFVRKATTPRNQHFTFKDDGFYKTLKSKIVLKLFELPKDLRKKSDRVTDLLFVAILVLSPLSCWAWDISFRLMVFLTIFNSLVLNFLVTSTHSYFHRADNWRMYMFDLNGQSFHDWRISHSMSHHLFTNTIQDAELILLEPFFQFLPYNDKPLWARFVYLYLPLPSIIMFIKPLWILFLGLRKGEKLEMKWTNTIQFFLPAWMYLFGGQTFLFTMGLWIVTSFITRIFFVLFGFTAGHLIPDNFAEGDIPIEESVDWGIHQMNTTMERMDFAGKHFFSITSFGDHVLHHLFPTLDPAELDYLYPILLEHCKEFGIELRTTTFSKAALYLFTQIMRKGPNYSAKKVNAAINK